MSKDYPERLLPNENSALYSQETIKDRTLLRWHDPKSTKKPGTIFNSDGSVKGGQIYYQRFPGLSCNLSPPSTCDDSKFICLDSEFNEPYEIGTKSPDIEDINFEYDENKEVIKLKTSEFIDTKLPYQYDGKNKIGYLRINHKPTKCNFSHCEFKLDLEHMTPDEVVEFRSRKGWRKLLILKLREIIELHAVKC